MRNRTRSAAATAVSISHALSHTRTQTCACVVIVYMRDYLVRRDEGVVQPALQHVLELSAIAMVFGHLGVAAARDHLHSHSPYMSSATLTMEKLYLVYLYLHPLVIHELCGVLVAALLLRRLRIDEAEDGVQPVERQIVVEEPWFERYTFVLWVGRTKVAHTLPTPDLLAEYLPYIYSPALVDHVG